MLGELLATSCSPLGALFVGLLRHVDCRDSEGGSAHTRVSNVLNADSSQQIKRDASSLCNFPLTTKRLAAGFVRNTALLSWYVTAGRRACNHWGWRQPVLVSFTGPVLHAAIFTASGLIHEEAFI